MRTTTLLGTAAAFIWAAGAVAGNGGRPENAALDLGFIMSKVMAGGGPGPGTPEKLPDFEEVTKDMVSREGFFTLWSYPEAAATEGKDPQKLLCQIPSSRLMEKFMLSISFSGGGFFTGFPLDERVVQWKLLGNQLLLVEPETHFVVDASKEVSDVVERTYPERIRAAVPLVTKTKGGDPVIDLGALLKSDFADISWMSLFESGSPSAVNPALSEWSKKKSFEHNVEIGVALALSQMSPPGSFTKKLVHFSFWELQKSDYTPRCADDRVGYFLTANQDWSKPATSRDIFNRYVDRWNLVKRDPSLALCEPVVPITYYIEKTVPVRYRRAVRDGILEWNKAFQKVGFVNAIDVRQQDDDPANQWKDLDPEDMRYSFFRWIVTGAGFAMGPHRANPFTGQIYDADIIFDDSMVRFFEQSMNRLVTDDALAMQLNDPAMSAFLEAHPEWRRPQHGWESLQIGGTNDAAMGHAMFERMQQRGRHCCDYALGMRHEMTLANAFLSTEAPAAKEQFLYEMIKEVVMHEVGHTLGLRHNFKASSIFTLDEIKQRSKAGEATTGSVMDYNPALFMADGNRDGTYVTPTIGPYDYWAIEYGYKPFDGSAGPAAEATPEPGQTPSDKASPAAAPKARASMPEPQKMKEMLAQMPPEVLAQVPPEVKAMIESGKMDMQFGAGAHGKAAASGTPPAGSGGGASFKSAPCGEAAMLQGIAGRATQPELAYASDEDATSLSPDPRVNRFDASADPVAWANERVTLVNKRMDNILEWAVKDAESWYYMRPTFVSLLFEKARVFNYVGRYIGGQYVTRAHRGDPDAPPPFVNVDPRKQREVLHFMQSNVFNENFFGIRPEVLNHLASPRWWHDGANVDFVVDFPIHELIGFLQWWNLLDRLNPNTLRRIQDAEMKFDASADGKFTAAEYLQGLQQACWPALYGEAATAAAGTDAAPFISDVQRSLQREYLSLVEPLVRNRPGVVLSPDLHAMVTYNIEQLKDRIDKTLVAGAKIDFASRAHLRACQQRIERMQEAPLEEYQDKRE